MALKWIEVTVKLVGEDYKESMEVYTQRINYEYFQQAKPSMVAEIAAIVNDLPQPRPLVPPGTWQEILPND